MDFIVIDMRRDRKKEEEKDKERAIHESFSFVTLIAIRCAYISS